jgi:phosphoenolpyruvate---glycerone phosphotransferase subunit DhaM
MTGSVGIVLVSHSDRLARGLRELVGQLTAGAVPVEVAGGTDDGRLGTSYALVRTAIKQADVGAGVVVLCDLGSAVLTARTVLEDDPREDVVLVDASFVDLTTVVAAATDARDAHKL